MSAPAGHAGGAALAPPPAAASISVRGLAKSYGEIEAVRGIDFEVAPGEIFGFLGPNGAGKSTTIKHALHAGRADRRPAPASPATTSSRERDEVRRNIGLVFQDTTLDDYLTRRAEPALPRRALRRAARAIGPRMRAGAGDGRALGAAQERASRTFSGGMKRRLEIARGLLHSPRVLFLDEPTVGLDPQTRSSIWGYIRELKQPRTSRSS